jgi:GNAT superfamily N-acetyltransferase
MTTSKAAQLDFEILSAAETLHVYKSRAFWEDRFRVLGLWSEMLDYDPISRRYSPEIDRYFLQFQLIAALRSDSNRVLGIAHAVPLHTGGHIESLPETGWDWAVETAILGHAANLRPDTICGLSITVLPQFQRCGVGKMLIEEIVFLAAKLGFQNVIMPVRPISKHRWPFISMHEFLTWRHRNLHDDPWIRAHEHAGGVIAGICKRSMTITAPLSKWERWCESKFSESGVYPFRGGLAPVTIDLDRNVGFYEEPNVWLVHRCPSQITKGGIHA